MTSTGSDLRSRIQQKQETANQQIEETTERELKNFHEHLRSITADALNTTRRATAEATDDVRAEVERLVVAEATEIGKGRERVQADLQALESDTGRTSARVHALLLRRWGVSLVMGLTFCLGISIGSWGLMQWLSSRVQSELDLLDELRIEIATARLTLERLEDRTWGMTLIEDEEGRRYVVLPRGTSTSRPLNLGGRRPVFVLPNN